MADGTRRDTARIEIARVYDPPDASDARRLLVDRLWPRGQSRDALNLDAWIPEVAPSTELRKWFNHDPAKWREFEHRYRAELAANPQAIETCLAWCRKGPVRLLYGSRNREHNHAQVLRQHLEALLNTKGGPT